MAQLIYYSTKKISQHLVDELTGALKSIDSYGSVEIYVQNSVVTQITTRNIKKTPTGNGAPNHSNISGNIRG